MSHTLANVCHKRPCNGRLCGCCCANCLLKGRGRVNPEAPRARCRIAHPICATQEHASHNNRNGVDVCVGADVDGCIRDVCVRVHPDMVNACGHKETEKNVLRPPIGDRPISLKEREQHYCTGLDGELPCAPSETCLTEGTPNVRCQDGCALHGVRLRFGQLSVRRTNNNVIVCSCG